MTRSEDDRPGTPERGSGPGDSIEDLVPDTAGASDASETDGRTRSDDSRSPDDNVRTADDDHTGQSVRSDGGAVDSPFETTSSVTETRGDRINQWIRDYVRTPVGIMREDWRAAVGLAIVGFYFLMGTVGVYLVEPTYPAHGPQLVPPFETWAFPLGTTQTGKDILSMTVNSTPTLLVMMASGALFTVTVGTTFGLVAGYKGGTVDTVLSTITDVFINLPGLPLVIVLATLLEDWIQNPVALGVLLAVAAWAGLARAIRSQVLTIRSESFIESARAMDLSTRWILSKEILPHLMPYVVVNFVNAARRIIFAAVALYFLGVLPFSDANWGVMLNNAYQSGAIYRSSAVHWLLVPMVAISGISVGLILLAQSLDRVFNPRARARHQADEATGPDADSESETQDMMNV